MLFRCKLVLNGQILKERRFACIKLSVTSIIEAVHDCAPVRVFWILDKASREYVRARHRCNCLLECRECTGRRCGRTGMAYVVLKNNWTSEEDYVTWIEFTTMETRFMFVEPRRQWRVRKVNQNTLINNKLPFLLEGNTMHFCCAIYMLQKSSSYFYNAVI